MTTWEELQPHFRAAVFARRRQGLTFAEVAREIPVSRRTIYNLIAKRTTPFPVTVQAIERFVEEGNVARSDAGSSQD